MSSYPPQLHALGHDITPGGVHPQESKVAALRNMPVPVDRTGVRSFIGPASYYRRFIQGFAAHALPLTKLIKLDVPWEWGPEQQDAFEFFKHALTNAPILVRPGFSIPFTLPQTGSLELLVLS